MLGRRDGALYVLMVGRRWIYVLMVDRFQILLQMYAVVFVLKRYFGMQAAYFFVKPADAQQFSVDC